MTNEFIYNLKNIFSDGPESVLKSTGMKMFYIGPYQRSYKWQSEGKFDQVPQLLNDVYDAWKNNPESEYFLQYITVKADKCYCRLEVIDGQQRLTTLSLLFYQLGQINSNDNIAIDKLNYSRYNNGNIFKEVCEYCNIHATINAGDFNEQDKYYMVKASKCIKNKLNDWQKEGNLDKVKDYLFNNVRIIVNIESNFVKSEDIFANLNDNHVPLTDAYLIKGLLLTNAVSRVNAYGRSLEYTEIQEKRKNLGRMWDEIQTWIMNAEHSLFFFKHTNIGSDYNSKYSMEYLLEFAYLYKFQDERSQTVGDYSQKRLELFNKYNSKIKSTDDAIEMIRTIEHIYHKMVTVFEGNEYNLWGFIQFSKSLSGEDKMDIYTCFDKSEQDLRTYLKNESVKRIPDLGDEEIKKDDYQTMRYKSKNDKLTNLLLSFSVFLPMSSDENFRFQFYDYDMAKWSFEHISPQNPKGLIQIPGYAKRYVVNEIDKKSYMGVGEEEKEKLKQVKDNVGNGVKIEASDVEFLFDSDIDEHSMGNMALLSREDNSANNNNPFMVKKLIIQSRKGNGAFIPNHTYEVFNKIMVSTCSDNPFSAETFIWGKQDIEAHVKWMEEANKKIFEWLNKAGNK